MNKGFPSLHLETKLWQAGFYRVVGVDEVGRGALAGPLCVGAVLVTADQGQIEEVKDSKQLSAATRVELAGLIRSAHEHSLGWVSAKDIDSVGLRQAWEMALIRAVTPLKPDAILIDGPVLPRVLSTFRCQTIVRGDQFSYSIAAASIVAKVARDVVMSQVRIGQPFFWNLNKGYATKSHRQALSAVPVTTWHRHSFLSRVRLCSTNTLFDAQNLP